jgi:hypothetical protein
MSQWMRLIAVAAVGAALTLGAAPALADQGGVSQEESCGFGQVGSDALRENEGIKKKDQRPGAGESRDLPPDECNESDKN